MISKTSWIWDERFLNHDTGKVQYIFEGGEVVEPCDEFENKHRMTVIKEMIEKSGLAQHLVRQSPYEATEEDLLRVHTKDHIQRVQKACKAGTREIGPEAYASAETEGIARLSAGAVMKAVDTVMESETISKVYAQIRPPGHHASSDQAMGFCFYNNVAVGAAYAIEHYGLKRIVILDWDVHHGNGTQDIFYERDDVLVISIHEEDYFPLESGQVHEIGQGKGEGYNINIPVPPLTGDEGYQYVFESIIAPVIKQFQPELIIISAGQDANALDPISRLMVTREGFKYMANKMRELAESYCEGRLIVAQEGGYNLAYLPIATMGVVEGLTGIDVNWKDPHILPQRKTPPALFEAVDNVINYQKRFWKFAEKESFC
ncbi:MULTISPECIES: class II histone deacetylase [Priestia]|uniref:class II histone deacetylase n=1 Tax=Priestia TaxID=2800373 RepID=UPI001C8EAF6C|nr:MULTISPECIES: class II histone deacetylase [Priestia]MBX9987816.1 class II histone deacetylase [Priestia aryabhattai]UYV54068.1 class II histone deacetylase [Priestia megaterium]